MTPHAIFERIDSAVSALCRLIGTTVTRAIAGVAIPVRFSVLCGLCAAALLAAALGVEPLIRGRFAFETIHLSTLESTGFFAALTAFRWTACIACAATIAGAAMALRLQPRNMLCLRVIGFIHAGLWVSLLAFLLEAPRVVYLAHAPEFHRNMRNELWLGGIALWLGGVLPCAAFMWTLFTGSATDPYTKAGKAGLLIGDRLIALFARRDADSSYRSSVGWSTMLHVVALILIPILLRGCGWEAPYTIPKGEGEKVVLAQMRLIKKKVEREKLILSINTDILFHIPDPDESDVLRVALNETEHTYTAQGVEGELGAGSGGQRGWPDGMPGRVRFLRLQYDGGDWDQDLALGADDNMLVQFSELTGFGVARHSEHRRINRLRFFPKGKAPPFVFLTGRGGVALSGHEIKVLREYCLKEGGMIFADNGGGSFDRSFRAAMRRLFPGQKWITISNDDPLFRYPYTFPNGAPPLWHHSGTKAVGLKHHGRWIVFYHQGDLNDAWKTGHSGIDAGLANQAYKMGVNIMFYAFTHYLDQHRGS